MVQISSHWKAPYSRRWPHCTDQTREEQSPINNATLCKKKCIPRYLPSYLAQHVRDLPWMLPKDTPLHLSHVILMVHVINKESERASREKSGRQHGLDVTDWSRKEEQNYPNGTLLRTYEYIVRYMSIRLSPRAFFGSKDRCRHTTMRLPLCATELTAAKLVRVIGSRQ